MKSRYPLLLAALLAGCAETPTPATTPPAEAESPAPSPSPASASASAPAPAPAPEPRRGQVTSISIERIFPLKLEDRVLLVDVRRGFFHRLGHIDGSIHLPQPGFAKAFPEMKPRLDQAVAAGKVIVTYCQSETCPDARKTAEALAARGYDVSVYPGGYDEWKSAGLDGAGPGAP